jgi:hypothetical protein
VAGLVARVTAAALLDGDVGLGGGGPAAARQRSLAQRWEDLEHGGMEWLPVTVLGDVPWRPPSFDARRPIQLRSTGALTQGGWSATTVRHIPLPDLEMVALRRPRDQEEIAADPHAAWVVEVRCRRTGRTGGFAGALPDLAMLAGVAGWPVPANLPGHPAPQVPDPPALPPYRVYSRTGSQLLLLMASLMFAAFIVPGAVTGLREAGVDPVGGLVGAGMGVFAVLFVLMACRGMMIKIVARTEEVEVVSWFSTRRVPWTEVARIEEPHLAAFFRAGIRFVLVDGSVIVDEAFARRPVESFRDTRTALRELERYRRAAWRRE